jgi:hypothetical protein
MGGDFTVGHVAIACRLQKLMGAVFTYAANAGLVTKNIAAEINRRHDLPETTEAEQRYLTHPQLLDLAKETARFETLTSVLGYCGCRFGEAAALRRRTSVIGRSPSAPRPHTSQDKESWKRTTRPNGEGRASCSRVVRVAICRWVSTAGYSTGHRRPCGTRPKPSANKSWLMTVK